MLYFNCVVVIRVLFLFPHGVVDWSEVCDCEVEEDCWL